MAGLTCCEAPFGQIVDELLVNPDEIDQAVVTDQDFALLREGSYHLGSERRATLGYNL